MFGHFFIFTGIMDYNLTLFKDSVRDILLMQATSTSVPNTPSATGASMRTGASGSAGGGQDPSMLMHNLSINGARNE